MKDKLRESYAKLSKDYEHNVDTSSAVNAFYERPAMMELIPQDLTGVVALDAGCAAGWYTERFIGLGADVTALDFSPEMVAATKRRVGDHATVFCHDLSEPLPFQDQSFDLIVSSLTLHYIDDWTGTFREFNRILKPDGQFVFSVHHPFMDFTSFERPDYFARELLTDVWTKEEAGTVEVTFFRRPLQEIMNVTTKYFTIEQIVEPQATLEFKETGNAGWYKRLMTTPHFLLVKSRKRTKR